MEQLVIKATLCKYSKQYNTQYTLICKTNCMMTAFPCTTNKLLTAHSVRLHAAAAVWRRPRVRSSQHHGVENRFHSQVCSVGLPWRATAPQPPGDPGYMLHAATKKQWPDLHTFSPRCIHLVFFCFNLKRNTVVLSKALNSLTGCFPRIFCNFLNKSSSLSLTHFGRSDHLVQRLAIVPSLCRC